MIQHDLTGTTALVTGASRGLGRGIATALIGTGATVVGVARNAGPLEAVRAELGARFVPVAADATNPDVARVLLAQHRPRVLVLNAGATPTLASLQTQTWQTFGQNWEVDTRHVFEWVGSALRLPLPAGSVVISISSGAALAGSPLSGGYAGANATIRFISAYAQREALSGALGVRFVSVLPQLTPATELGAPAVAAYAELEGIDVASFVGRMQPVLTPKQAGESIVELALGSSSSSATSAARPEAYLLTGRGLKLLE